jgi:lysophospholipase L1-like esterase
LKIVILILLRKISGDFREVASHATSFLFTIPTRAHESNSGDISSFETPQKCGMIEAMKKAHTLTLLIFLRKTTALVFLIALLAVTADILRFVTILIVSPTVGGAVATQDHPYEHSVVDAPKRILIAGDSTAVGVGAYVPEETIAGMLSRDIPDATIENVAVSGAQIHDAVEQIKNVDGYYDCILVQVGANDVVYFTDENEVYEKTREMMDIALLRGNTVIVMPPFDVSIAPLIPRVMSFIISDRSGRMIPAIGDIVEEKGGIFIDLYKSSEEELFREEPDVLFSADSFHPSSDGYALVYERVKNELLEQNVLCME